MLLFYMLFLTLQVNIGNSNDVFLAKNGHCQPLSDSRVSNRICVWPAPTFRKVLTVGNHAVRETKRILCNCPKHIGLQMSQIELYFQLYNKHLQNWHGAQGIARFASDWPAFCKGKSGKINLWQSQSLSQRIAPKLQG